MMTIEELENIMREYGVAIRAIPMKTRETFHPRHADQFPDGHFEYVETFGCEMRVAERVPKNAGKFLIESVKHTCSQVHFENRPFDSIEDAVRFLCKEKLNKKYGTIGNDTNALDNG